MTTGYNEALRRLQVATMSDIHTAFLWMAQQDAERSKFVVAKAEQEKLAAIILAEGEGEAAGLISDVR